MTLICNYFKEISYVFMGETYDCEDKASNGDQRFSLSVYKLTNNSSLFHFY